MGGQLRVLSANLANGLADPGAFAELVQAVCADVVAVQELAPEQAEALGEILPHHRLEPARDYTGMGIAAARPVRLARVPLCYRDARAAHLDPADWPGLPRAVEILNVHILAPTAPAAWVQPLRRHRQVSDLVGYLDATPERTRAVVGDFNATAVFPAYRRVARRLEDLALAHARGLGRPPRRTWRRWPVGPRLLRLDHCFARGLAVERIETLDVRGSDHDALLVELSVA